MKKIEATITPYSLDEIRDALMSLGIDEMSVSEAKSLRPESHPGWSRGSEYVVWFAPRYRLEIIARDDQVRDCIDAIRERIQSGDGTIVVLPVGEVIRARTDQHLARAA